MLSDIALFEPNQRGRRAFDVFLAAKARQLDAADFELAQRMGKAFFSLFRCSARHEFGLRTSSTETEAFGLWMKAWRRPPRQTELLACAYSTPANSMLGLGSLRRRMRRQPNSASRV